MKTLRLVFLLAMPILLWTNSIATPTNYGYRHIMGSAQQNEQGVKRLANRLCQNRTIAFIANSATFRT